MKTFIRCSLILVLSLIAAPVYADEYQKGRDAFNQLDYKTALSIWRPLAKKGHVHAQTRIGYMYDSGRGVPQSYAKAAEWYRKAADLGDRSAQFNLGLLYEHGKGFPKNLKNTYN